MTTPTISESARRAAEQEIDEFLYRSRITQPRRPFEAGHYVQQALDSAHPASAEDQGYKVCFPYARIGDMTPALFKDGAYYYISAHPAPKEGEAKVITVTWKPDRGNYYVSIPDWDGGDVVLLADYEALQLRLSEAKREVEALKTVFAKENARAHESYEGMNHAYQQLAANYDSLRTENAELQRQNTKLHQAVAKFTGNA